MCADHDGGQYDEGENDGSEDDGSEDDGSEDRLIVQPNFRFLHELQRVYLNYLDSPVFSYFETKRYL